MMRLMDKGGSRETTQQAIVAVWVRGGGPGVAQTRVVKMQGVRRE